MPAHRANRDAFDAQDAPNASCTPAAQSLRSALQRHDLFTPHQVATRRWPIGCVSLEITQRCNLDCSLCYLSEHSEAIQDFPLEEIYRRIDMIAQQYGANCDVQISGGDPTLRDHDELELIVQRIVSRGMRASLFTNGILASRELLLRLRAAGLTDVAFHVDMTQQRKGYADETQLNALRLEYIARARGLGLSVFFNTTVHEANIADVPALVRFFAEQSDVVRLASFQMQAATGRGLLGERPGQLTQQRMMELIEQGAGTALNWDALLGGHPQCNRYATALVLGNASSLSMHDLFADAAFIARAMRETAHVVVPRHSPWRAAWVFARAVLMRPRLALAGMRWLLRLAWQLRAQLWRITQAPPRKISYFIHNFMDANELVAERIETCVFMAAGPTGLVPMCEFNAQRDAHLLRPLALADGQIWQPLRAPHLATVRSDAHGLVSYPIKYLKGRSRVRAMAQRHEHGHTSVHTSGSAPSELDNPTST